MDRSGCQRPSSLEIIDHLTLRSSCGLERNPIGIERCRKRRVNRALISPRVAFVLRPGFSTETDSSPNFASWTCSPPPASNFPAPAEAARAAVSAALAARALVRLQGRRRGQAQSCVLADGGATRRGDRLCAPRQEGFGKLKEVAVRPIFISSILETVLGYKSADPESVYTLAYERAIRRGAVDVALGRFDDADGLDEIVAPFELKGPTTLRSRRAHARPRPQPRAAGLGLRHGRAGPRWVLVSNCLEIRLYGFGRGRDAYEVFDLAGSTSRRSTRGCV